MAAFYGLYSENACVKLFILHVPLNLKVLSYRTVLRSKQAGFRQAMA